MFAVIAGTTVRLTEFSRLPDETGGKRQRTLSGKRRGDVLWTARNWQGRALCFTDAEANALRALADDLTSRACTGEGFPAGGVNCHVAVENEPYDRLPATYWRTPLLTFREAL